MFGQSDRNSSSSPIQDYVHPGDLTQPTFEMTPGFKPFTMVLLLLIDVKYFSLSGAIFFFVFGSNKIGNGQTKLSFKLKLLTALSISRGKFGLIFDFLEHSLKISIVFYSLNWKWPNETFLHTLCS